VDRYNILSTFVERIIVFAIHKIYTSLVIFATKYQYNNMDGESPMVVKPYWRHTLAKSSTWWKQPEPTPAPIVERKPYYWRRTLAKSSTWWKQPEPTPAPIIERKPYYWRRTLAKSSTWWKQPEPTPLVAQAA